MIVKATPQIVKKEELSASRWLRFVNLQYTTGIQGDSVRQWQAVERTTTTPAADGSPGIDAVAVFAVIRRKGCEPRLLIVKQFRPPVGKMTVELCAGLVDAGETPEVTALRELKEETGYTGKVISSTGRQYLSPGITGENIVTVFVEIDGDAPVNKHPKPQEEDAGIVTKDDLPLSDLFGELQRLEAEGYAIWVGLWSLAQGMRIRSLIPNLGE